MKKICSKRRNSQQIAHVNTIKHATSCSKVGILIHWNFCLPLYYFCCEVWIYLCAYLYYTSFCFTYTLYGVGFVMPYLYIIWEGILLSWTTPSLLFMRLSVCSVPMELVNSKFISFRKTICTSWTCGILRHSKDLSCYLMET